jgi:hypothetical protein
MIPMTEKPFLAPVLSDVSSLSFCIGGERRHLINNWQINLLIIPKFHLAGKYMVPGECPEGLACHLG